MIVVQLYYYKHYLHVANLVEDHPFDGTWKSDTELTLNYALENSDLSEEDIRVIVHPECPMEVVDLADEAGSTAYIIRRVEESPPGTKCDEIAGCDRNWRYSAREPALKILPCCVNAVIDARDSSFAL